MGLMSSPLESGTETLQGDYGATPGNLLSEGCFAEWGGKCGAELSISELFRLSRANLQGSLEAELLSLNKALSLPST